ncbi:MAG: outer membrane protein transport protein [Burkholderiales bacterium]|nr:outer membrane protein transport protein [Burkholderiales bacterium]
MTTKFGSVVMGGVLACAAPGVAAGGFAVLSQGAASIGYSLAGTAAAEDASTIWWNPAGMTQLGKGVHAVGTLHLIRPSFEFRNTASSGAFAAAGSGEGGDAGSVRLNRQAFAAIKLTDDLALGLGVNAPFGLKTEYHAGWRGQLTALESESRALNVNPAIAYRASKQVSLGAGLNYQRFEATLTNFAGPALGVSTLEAKDSGIGWNVGVLFHPSETTRIGLAYRSAIRYSLAGSASFSANPAANSGAVADLKVPDSFSIAVFTELSPAVALMGDVTWTGWSSVKTLTPIRTSASVLGAAGSAITTLPFEWRDTLRASVALRYAMSKQLSLRLGLGYDQGPSNDAKRTPRLPDEDRVLLSIGASYLLASGFQVELAWMHQFVKDAAVNVAVPNVPGALVGRFDNAADIVSLQLGKSF